MKHEWKKHEKNIYLPKNSPEIITLPKMKYFTISGKGNPNDEFFSNYIEALYSLSYAVKMYPKSGKTIEGYFEYTVYPLEGVWDIENKTEPLKIDAIDKNNLIFNLMIRQPDFLTPELAQEAIEKTMKKKPHELLKKVKFEITTEGNCIQMLHTGSYDNEPASFAKMEAYAKEINLKRKSHTHREIYLSDARKTAEEKLKTVLRFEVE